MKRTKQQKKRTYVCPKVSKQCVEMEWSIAAGSANTEPGNESSAVKSEWSEGTDSNSSIAW